MGQESGDRAQSGFTPTGLGKPRLCPGCRVLTCGKPGFERLAGSCKGGPEVLLL